MEGMDPLSGRDAGGRDDHATRPAGGGVADRAAALAGRLGIEPRLLWQLAGLALLAFLIRLVPMLLTGGLRGIVDYDDGVYMGSSLALARGRVVYRDFYMLHPPGIVYVLSPFALLSLVTSDANAFSAARVGFMLLGAANTFLVGLLASRAGRTAALAAAALYMVWFVPARVERSTWLIAPQTLLLLLALLVLVRRGRDPGGTSIGWRRTAVAGALIGFTGAIQIWNVVPAAVVFVWLAIRTLRQPGGPLRPLVAYCVAGVSAVGVAFLPFYLFAGEKLIRIVIFDQIGRNVSGMSIPARIRAMEGLGGVISRFPVLSAVPVILFVVVVVAILVVAWRRPVVRLWAALFLAQTALLFVSPSFFGHYGGWPAPFIALGIGAVVGELLTATPALRGRVRVVGAVYGVGLAGLLLITLVPRVAGLSIPSKHIPWQAIAAEFGDARCPTSDSPTLLIETGALRRMLDNGCPLLVSPTGVSYDTDQQIPRKERSRPKQPEYQAIMAGYFGGSDAAAFIRKPANVGLTDATWSVIRANLPVEKQVGSVRLFLPAGR